MLISPHRIALLNIRYRCLAKPHFASLLRHGFNIKVQTAVPSVLAVCRITPKIKLSFELKIIQQRKTKKNEQTQYTSVFSSTGVLRIFSSSWQQI